MELLQSMFTELQNGQNDVLAKLNIIESNQMEIKHRIENLICKEQAV